MFMYSHVVPRTDWIKQKKSEIQPCLKKTAVAQSQTHIVSIAPDNIISHHLQGEIPANIMGNPVKEARRGVAGGGVGGGL